MMRSLRRRLRQCSVQRRALLKFFTAVLMGMQLRAWLPRWTHPERTETTKEAANALLARKTALEKDIEEFEVARKRRDRLRAGECKCVGCRCGTLVAAQTLSLQPSTLRGISFVAVGTTLA